jgi:NTP pyrophosphatase (non-canonical NTP hydrolase)
MGTGLAEFQARIEAIYGARDRARGLATTFMWFAEEVGELSRALRRTDAANLREEFADVLAWLVTLASITGVDIEQAANKYAAGCPRCRRTPCGCPSQRPAASGGTAKRRKSVRRKS